MWPLLHVRLAPLVGDSVAGMWIMWRPKGEMARSVAFHYLPRYGFDGF
jgi:hypothetical protein